MVFIFGGWIVMLAVMIGLALHMPGRAALVYWALFATAMCALGGFAISRQPIGTPTAFGAIGSSVVRFGFRAGHGRLLPAIAISALVWSLMGLAVITMIRSRADRQHLLMVLAWTVDVGFLFHIAGLVLANFGGSRQFISSLSGVGAVVIAMIVVSAFLWNVGGTAAARRLALLIAGGPPLLIGGGYGLFLLVTMTIGRNARWN